MAIYEGLSKRHAVSVLLVALVAVLTTTAGVEGRAASPCGLRDAKTLRTSKDARVVEKRNRVYACLSRHGRPFLLGPRHSELGQVRALRLAGRFVGYSRAASTGLRVTVRELRRGRVVHDALAAVVSRAGATSLTDLRLRRNGSVAWIVRTLPFDVPLDPYRVPEDSLPDYEVGKSDRTGRALLDKGHDIGSGSLRLNGATVSWRKGGRRYSAVLV